MQRRTLCYWLLAVFSLACERSDPPAQPEPAPSSSAPVQPAPRAALVGPPLSSKLSLAGADDIVAIGDLHGDLEATRRVLRLAKIIDEKDQWIGEKRVVVQTGDEIDRGDEDRKVLDFIDRLRPLAKKAGGDVIALSGNHELMNVARDFRYVTPASYEEFGGGPGRAQAFQPGGPYARMLAERPILFKIGDTVFVHGGILTKHVQYGLDRMNDEVRAWMLGERPEPPAVVVAEDGPVWTRRYSSAPQEADCQELADVLKALGAKRMVVGHTVQQTGVNSACHDQVWRIDVGLSHHYGGPTQALEIKRDTVAVLR